MGGDLTIAEWLKPYLPILAAVVRGLLQIASGLGFAWALTVTGDQVTMIVTMIAALLSFGWSIWQKIAAIREKRAAEVAAARASAAATMSAGTPTPVTVTVTPAGQPNVATRVPPAEPGPAMPPADVRTQPAPIP